MTADATLMCAGGTLSLTLLLFQISPELSASTEFNI